MYTKLCGKGPVSGSYGNGERIKGRWADVEYACESVPGSLVPLNTASHMALETLNVGSIGRTGG